MLPWPWGFLPSVSQHGDGSTLVFPLKVEFSSEFGNLGGLVAGFGLGIVLLWSALRINPRSMRTVMALYVAWIGIFAWYWFHSYTLNEVHSFDPQKLAREQAQHAAISIGFFLLWVALYSIGPVLTARRFQH